LGVLRAFKAVMEKASKGKKEEQAVQENLKEGRQDVDFTQPGEWSPSGRGGRTNAIGGEERGKKEEGN